MTDQTLSGIETVRRFYALMGEDRFEEAEVYLSDAVMVRESRDLPFGGDYHGLAGNAELVGKMLSAFELAIRKADFFDAGPVVAARLRACFTPRAGGDPVELDIVELLKVEGGKIVDIDIYHKTPSVVAAMWPG